MKKETVTIAIPHDVAFADLHLSRDAQTGDVSFDWAPVERICVASGIDVALLRDGPEDNVSALLMHWYSVALASGEPPDPVQEQLLAEISAEDAFGIERVQRGSGRAQ